MADKLRAHGKTIVAEIVSDPAICYLPRSKEVIERLPKNGAVLVLACGAGAQSILEVNPELLIFPGTNSRFLGMTAQVGEYHEKCTLCGYCLLHLTGGICPLARCPKNVLNGPCGDCVDGKCGISSSPFIKEEIDCVWALIYDRLKKIGKTEILSKTLPSMDWSKTYKPQSIELSEEEIKQRGR
ncbi:MAG: methylenetetrahydrofolate reductase C-terminal domain-containing protein [Euryarchaeota archaeon]|nr:methylenetetrahydrofolate reductase C-terminal domain-containing protein [Euryarchaeota archaeon]